MFAPRRLFSHLTILTVTAFLAAASRGGAQGAAASISGTVTDSSSKRPLAGAEITVITDAGTLAGSGRVGETGRYTVAANASGLVTVRVRLVGYTQQQRRLTLSAGGAYTADFQLVERMLQLDQVVVTGTAGVTQRRAVGNVVNTVDAQKVLETAPVRSVEQLLGARTPGLIVLPATGQVGTGAQLRVRGASSLSLSNEPIVYIDGIRMDATASRGPGQRGGAGASRLNDINPNDIESIEVIKGPAASTLYGTEASNGVIQIITKRGKSGKPKFDFTTRQGTNWLQNPEGRAGLRYGLNTTTGQIISANIYEEEAQNGAGPMFTNGRNSGYSASLSGGTDDARYFMSASYDNDVGVVKHNNENRFSGRLNLDLAATKTLRLQGSLGYVRGRTRLAQGAINIDPFSQLVWSTPLNLGTVRRGFYNSPPEYWDDVESRADIDRTTMSLKAQFNPRPWFTHRFTTGVDVGSENNGTLYPRFDAEGQLLLGADGLGSKSSSRSTRTVFTLDYAGSLKYQLKGIDFTTSAGLQAFRNELSTIGASALTFPAGPVTTISGGATRNGSEDYLANATVGVFVQQEIGWNNRVFLTAAMRGDDNSTFGKDFSAMYYPKLSGSWVMSEESWFKLPQVQSFRLRGALGAAGTQPGTFDASRLYDPTVGYQNAPGLAPASFGNPQLRPERSIEFEGGFEAALFDGRASVEYTHYDRRISDAIVNSPIPPSIGFPGSQVVNIGRVSGWGDELNVNLNLLNGDRVAWEFGTQLANNRNRIDDMGATQFLTVGGGGQAQNRVGFGIADFFMYKVKRATITSTGAVTESICDGGTGQAGLMQGGADVPCATAPRVFWGHSQPTWQMGFNSTVTLWKNLRLYARVDGNGGHIQSNTEIRALHNQGSTEAVIKRNDPLLQVYRAIEADVVGTYKAGFLRLRELSATYTLGQRLARMVGASGGTISVAGRNLSMLWTAQHGWNTSRDGQLTVDIAGQKVWDPEIRNVGQLSNGYQTIMPPTSSFVTTVRLNF